MVSQQLMSTVCNRWVALEEIHTAELARPLIFLVLIALLLLLENREIKRTPCSRALWILQTETIEPPKKKMSRETSKIVSLSLQHCSSLQMLLTFS
jgi:hypothetical protein